MDTLPGRVDCGTGAYTWVVKNYSGIKCVGLPVVLSSPEFEIAGLMWQLTLYPHGYQEAGKLSKFLVPVQSTETQEKQIVVAARGGATASMTFTVVNHIFPFLSNVTRTRTVAVKDCGWGYDGGLLESHVLWPESGWLQDDCLTVKVEATVKVLRTDCYFRGLSEDFLDEADVELVVEGKYKLPCHSVILRLHSKVFDAILKKEAFDQDNIKPGARVRLPLIGETLSEVLHLLVSMYSPDRLAIEDIDEAKALLEVADKYNMPWLVAAVKAYLMPGLGQLEPTPGSVLRNVSAALAWLQHCQRYDIDDHVEICEALIGLHYIELARDRPEDLAALSSTSLVRISQAYAHNMSPSTLYIEDKIFHPRCA